MVHYKEQANGKQMRKLYSWRMVGDGGVNVEHWWRTSHKRCSNCVWFKWTAIRSWMHPRMNTNVGWVALGRWTKHISFKNNKPGYKWLMLLITRHLDIFLLRNVNVDSTREEATSPRKVATHVSSIKCMAETFDIQDPSQIFHVDESGFYIRGMRC